MKVSGLMLALAATVSTVMAAPSPNKDSELGTQGCPTGYDICGTCNGSSCKISGINHDCKSGTSCEGPGGGDGAICGALHDQSWTGPYTCPVKK